MRFNGLRFGYGHKAFLMLLAALVCGGECVTVVPQQYGRVEVLAFTAIGDRITNLTIDLIQVVSRKSFTSEFRDGVANRIPFGWYTARISSPGFHSIERELHLDQPEFSRRTQLNVALECGNTSGGVNDSVSYTHLTLPTIYSV